MSFPLNLKALNFETNTFHKREPDSTDTCIPGKSCWFRIYMYSNVELFPFNQALVVFAGGWKIMHSFGLVKFCLLELLHMCARWLNSSQVGKTGKASSSHHKVGRLQLFLSSLFLWNIFVIPHQNYCNFQFRFCLFSLLNILIPDWCETTNESTYRKLK